MPPITKILFINDPKKQNETPQIDDNLIMSPDMAVMTFTLKDPTHVQEAITLLKTSLNLFDQVDFLQCNKLKYCHNYFFINNSLI